MKPGLPVALAIAVSAALGVLLLVSPERDGYRSPAPGKPASSDTRESRPSATPPVERAEPRAVMKENKQADVKRAVALPEASSADLGRFKNSPVHAEWVKRIAEALPDTRAETKQRLAELNLQLLYRQAVVQDQYLAGSLPWNQYLPTLLDVMLQHDAAAQALLPHAEYEQLYGVRKDEAARVLESALHPPEEAEVFALFPEIKRNHPQITQETDLYQQVPANKVAELAAAKKTSLAAVASLERQLNDKKLSPEVFAAATRQTEADFLARAREQLTPAEAAILLDPSAADANSALAAGKPGAEK